MFITNKVNSTKTSDKSIMKFTKLKIRKLSKSQKLVKLKKTWSKYGKSPIFV